MSECLGARVSSCRRKGGREEGREREFQVLDMSRRCKCARWLLASGARISILDIQIVVDFSPPDI